MGKRFKDISVKLINKKYLILYHRGYKYKLLYGGRGSGKSWAIAEALVYYAYNVREFRVLCLREVQKSISTSSYAVIRDTIKRLGLGFAFEYTKQQIICKRTGAEFHFQGLSTTTQENIKSMEGYDVAWVEEAQCISKRSLELLLPTIRKHGSELWFSFNPELPSDPIYETFLGEIKMPRTLAAKINYDENPFLAEDVRAQAKHMEKTDPNKYNHIWKGNFNTESDEFLISLDVVREATFRTVAIDYNAKITAGLDVSKSGKDFNALVIRQDNRVIHLEKWSCSDTTVTIDRAVAKVLEMGGDSLVIDCQGLGDGMIDYARKTYNNFHFIEFKSSYKSKHPDHYFNARAEIWCKMKHWLANTGAIPSNKRLETGLTTIKNIGRDRIQLADKSTQPFSPDEADALAMTFWGNEDEYMSQSQRDELYGMLYGVNT